MSLLEKFGLRRAKKELPDIDQFGIAAAARDWFVREAMASKLFPAKRGISQMGKTFGQIGELQGQALTGAAQAIRQTLASTAMTSEELLQAMQRLSESVTDMSIGFGPLPELDEDREPLPEEGNVRIDGDQYATYEFNLLERIGHVPRTPPAHLYIELDPMRKPSAATDVLTVVATPILCEEATEGPYLEWSEGAEQWFEGDGVHELEVPEGAHDFRIEVEGPWELVGCSRIHLVADPTLKGLTQGEVIFCPLPWTQPKEEEEVGEEKKVDGQWVLEGKAKDFDIQWPAIEMGAPSPLPGNYTVVKPTLIGGQQFKAGDIIQVTSGGLAVPGSVNLEEGVGD